MKVLLKKIDDHIEEQVTLVCGDIEVICFASFLDFEIHEGHEYEVAFEMNVFETYSVNQSDVKKEMLEQVDDSFVYVLNGKLKGDTVLCGLPFTDDILLSDFGYLEGEYVRFKVDRIDVDFISMYKG